MTTPDPFAPGYRLTDGNQLNTVTAHPVWSVAQAVTAKVGGTATTSPLVTEAITNITSVGATGHYVAASDPRNGAGGDE